MNSKEQALRKQVTRKDDQVRALLVATEQALFELETLSSIACAFAFDYARGVNLETAWAEAVREVSK